ncbi:MAG: hypothetical protein DCC75_10110 [Proteobacteria bacterium]|nr:MAG: hypothetical protein DCC75_10110 [Pseudomonadota bacterium]
MLVERIHQTYTRLASRQDTQRTEAQHRHALTADAISFEGERREQKHQQSDDTDKNEQKEPAPEKVVVAEETQAGELLPAEDKVGERLDLRV